MPTNVRRPLFTLRTDVLAGRSEELYKLQRTIDQLQKISDSTLLFYIAGDGGMGKTRLLEWVRDKSQRPTMTICTQILDIYNSILRTDVDLVEQIFDDIENTLPTETRIQQWFEQYVQLRERFHRQEIGATGNQARGEVIEAFYIGWLEMLNAGYRLIVLLDTAELLRFEDDPIRKQLEALQSVASTKRWLSKVVLPPENPQEPDITLPGVLFIVAGRKDESKELYGELCELANIRTNEPLERIINLGGLSSFGVKEYLSVLAEKLKDEGYTVESSQIDELNDEERDAFYHLTGGSPISLAIALQLFIEGDSMDVVRLVDKQRKSLPSPLPNAQQELRKALVRSLAEQQAFDAASTAIRYMSLARKGLTPSRLQGLFPVVTESEIKKIFEKLEQLIFVKKRPEGSLVLHDKVADWTEEGIYGDRIERSKSVYQTLIDLYNKEIADIERRIDELARKADPIESDEVGKQEHPSHERSDPFAYESSREFRLARRHRRNLLVERMTYALRVEPVTGYKQYFELAEEAFNVGRMDYESQIRSEFLGWWDHQEPINSNKFKNREIAQANGLLKEIINADFVVRAVQREFNGVSPEIAPSVRAANTIALVDRINKDVDTGQIVLPLFTQILLNVYADMANGLLAESDEQIELVKSTFAEHIRKLDDLLERSRRIHHLTDNNPSAMPLEPFLILNALAFANYEFGFFESNHGNHGSAIQHYTDSLFPYRQLSFEINQARSLNDKAYSLAMVGDSDSAETAIADALGLRKRLGFSFLTALSYNTMGIVRTMGERPSTAIRYCEYALRTFQGLSHEYGQMIANRALSEACRRSAEYLEQNSEEQLSRLEQALDASIAATDLARQLLTPKDLFLSEVLDEFGCAYRDLARFRFRNANICGDKHQNAFNESRKLLEEATQVAEAKPSARSNLVDSMNNRAYLCFYQIFREDDSNLFIPSILDEAEQLVLAALDQVPIQYSQPNNDHHEPEDLTVYWAHLSKAHALRVHIARTHLQKNELTPENQAKYEDQLLRESTLTLYFRSLLQGNVRNVRKSYQAVYEALQHSTPDRLNRIYARADDVARELGLPVKKESLMRKFLRENFGVK